MPMLAAKYFPGHALVMSIGALAGWMALVPLVLQALSAALLFVLARTHRRRRSGVLRLGGVALVADGDALRRILLRAGYLVCCGARVVVCADAWCDSRKAAWLASSAFFVGWVAITRPLTGVAYVLPMAVVVLRDVMTNKRWRDLAVALAVGTAVIAIIPLWSAKTTGNWRTTPQTLYTRMYMPWDAPGFGFNATPPSRTLTREFATLSGVYGPIHARHLPSSLPSTLVERAQALYVSIWAVSSGLMGLFALVGLLTLRGPAAYALITSIVVVLAHLIYASPPEWTVYYYETTPTFAYLSAAGLAWAAAMIARPRGVAASASFQWRSPRLSSALVVGTLILAVPGYVTLKSMHYGHIMLRRDLDAFAALMRTIHDEKAIVFVRHSTMHSPHVAFVRNVPDLAKARIWVVYDRGDAENAALRKHDPARVAYLFDEQARKTYIYDPQAP